MASVTYGGGARVRTAATSPTSSVYSGGSQSSLSKARMKLKKVHSLAGLPSQSPRRNSLAPMKQAFVRSSNCFWAKRKFDVEDAYGMSEESNEFIPEDTQMNFEPLVVRYKACLSYCCFFL